MDAFSRLAPYIQDFIYQHKWEKLRELQVAAISIILDTKHHLILSSGTASGKTEAAFLPILTDLHYNPANSVGVLYISPLKALINDQFLRLDLLLQESNFKVTKWHGDASNSKKQALIKEPTGLLQITPESLEGLLCIKPGTVYMLFKDLKYIIIDEIHYFMRDPRGVQLLSILQRIQNIIKKEPRRIGLSATLGCVDVAKQWLSCGTHGEVLAPIFNNDPKKIKLYVERFVNYADKKNQNMGYNFFNPNLLGNGNTEHHNFLFKNTLDQKTLLFTNSREETEYIIANLKQIANKNKAPDIYRVHHGNVSTVLRESAEIEMKTSTQKIVTGATVTLELGIDLGDLDMVVQVGAPYSVASFAQRLGRCGRRGQTAKILNTFVETLAITTDDPLTSFNFDFIRIIAILECYLKDSFVEPIILPTLPFNILFHQTLSVLKANGEMSAPALATNLLGLEVFTKISADDYKILLKSMLREKIIERTELNGFILGEEGERIVNNHKFLSVFIAPEYLIVKEENKAVGTVDKTYPEGTRFALAGLTWEVIALNEKAKTIFVKKVPGISVVDWDVDINYELHTRLVLKMKEVLESTYDYPYLSEFAQARLSELREIAHYSNFLNEFCLEVSPYKFVLFPWFGTKELFSLMYLLKTVNISSSLKEITSVYLEVNFKGTKYDLINVLRDLIKKTPNFDMIKYPKRFEIIQKYSEHIPSVLLNKQFIHDALDFTSLYEKLKKILLKEPINHYGSN